MCIIIFDSDIQMELVSQMFTSILMIDSHFIQDNMESIIVYYYLENTWFMWK